MEIKVGKAGRILAGKEQGRYVKVIDDEANTGGYLILTAAGSDMQNGFDCWVESADMLQRFFEESGWVVEWP